MYMTRVSSLDHVPTVGFAQVTGCEKTCTSLSGIQLHLYNFIDFVVGSLLLFFGVYLYTKLGSEAFLDPDMAWLDWLCTLLGILMLLQSMMSFCGVTSVNMRYCISPSYYIGMVVCLLCIITGALFFACKSTVYAYINTQGDMIGLSGNEIHELKSWYDILGFLIFGIAIVEILRVRASKHYRENILRMDGEFDSLLAEEDRDYADKMERNRESREEKYDNLRSYYKDKYNKEQGFKGKEAAGGVAAKNTNNQF